MTITQGEDRNINIYYRSKNGRALTLTGATVTFIIATVAAPQTPVLSLTTTTYINETTGVSAPLDAKGIATVTISDTQSSALTVGSYVADAKVVDASGNDSISGTYQITVKARRS